ncbi:patatin-like phospholipase family protein [Metaclostridioides mangenotii]|uniref:Patatin-like phospholipase/acyl hydrolase n=1 Tax=Metaclostridioides mangenotii TaxID=1540 RepID=A0ABS4E7C3_9FIRM|nr:patatin-like phospholipase family protein [Clostridioides mangenotii]MBP1853848.1 patatin-like phospholipase/acyl hydrolase [Clostridioides mangenotii]
METSNFNILTFDGGGIRGALSIDIFVKILDRRDDVLKNTDLIGGTSTGSLIALGLAYGVSPIEIKELYSIENSKFIFGDKHSEMLRPKYDNDNLKEVLLRIFPEDLKLRDLEKMVLIPSLYIGDRNEPWRPIFYNNLPNSLTSEFNVVDVALASSAAPVFFPAYNRHIDGGIIAADPSLACIVYALDSCMEVRLDDIRLLSIGTGFEHNSISDDTTTWGAIDWMVNKDPSLPILSITLAGNSLVSQYFSQKLLKDNYYRLDPKLGKNIPMDDCASLPYLNSLGENYNIEHVLSWLGMKWQ